MGVYVVSPVCICPSRCIIKKLEAFEWIFTKLAVNDHHQDISVEFDFVFIL